MQEPSKGDKINEGIMKEITGSDPLQGRALYQSSCVFIPQFKLVVCTNTLFAIVSNDDGTWRRIRVCDFMSKFKEKPVKNDKDEPYQFKVNKKFTIGEWVYSQYVDGFKRGNLYYRPVYDKGYNFSRRYVPGSNISSFSLPQSTQIIENKTQLPNINGDENSKFNTFDQLPIID